jgi:hypothetical protein
MLFVELSGPKGDVGAVGPTGPAGSGNSGINGTSGSSGLNGSSGSSGTSGIDGSSGSSGLNGSSGSSGLNGSSGATGSSGSSGTSGTIVQISGIHGIAARAGATIGTSLLPQSTNNASNLLANNTLRILPFLPARTFTITSIKIEVAVGGGTATALFIKVYDDLNGTPNNCVISSGTMSATGGVKTHTTSYQFITGNLYWLGVNSNGTATMRALGSATNLAISSNTGSGNINNNNATIAQTASDDAWPGGAYTLALSNLIVFTFEVASVP